MYLAIVCRFPKATLLGFCRKEYCNFLAMKEEVERVGQVEPVEVRDDYGFHINVPNDMSEKLSDAAQLGYM